MKGAVKLLACAYLVATFLAIDVNAQNYNRRPAASGRETAYPARFRSGNGRAGGGAAGGGSRSPAFLSQSSKKPLLRRPRPEALVEDQRIEREAEERRLVVDSQGDAFASAANEFQDSFGDIQQQTMADADAQARHYGAPKYDGAPPANAERMAFQIHGHQGPQSYRYGFDTGKGYNRQFRYEEKDGKGIVHGRYGYYDKDGKLKIVNYTAHPKHGFAAEGNFGKFP